MLPAGGTAVRAVVLGCAFVLAACSALTVERPEPTLVFPPARASFEAAGRLSVRHGTDALTANFRWHHEAAHDDLDLASPLGQTIARLSGGHDGVELRTADGRIATASDWAALTAGSLDWSLPVDGLAFWIQGVPRPDAPFAGEPSAEGTLRLLRQDGWTIVYQAFTSNVADAVRPTRMTLSYPDIEVRLVVDSWQ
jgi:outer membrane lipoprotein LolB